MILFCCCFALSSLASGVRGGSASLGLSKDFVFTVWDVGLRAGKLSSFFKNHHCSFLCAICACDF